MQCTNWRKRCKCLISPNLDTEKNCAQGHRRGPLVFQDIEADRSSYARYVWVPDFCNESHLEGGEIKSFRHVQDHLWRVKWVCVRNLYLQLELPAGVRSVRRSCHSACQLREVICHLEANQIIMFAPILGSR